MNKRKNVLALLLTLVLTGALCLCLYRCDNKYTRREAQSISGVFFYDGSADYTSLVRQWVIYPDVLLTPETLEGYTGYRYYGDIGSRIHRGTGSLTYRMTLMLPETPEAYALELPEIFSACKVYLNGNCLLKLGDPSPEHFREGLQSRVLCFTGSGKTELLIAAADHSGICRGMTSPPGFGTVEAVLKVRELRLLLHGGLVLLALLGAAMALSFDRRGKGILGCLLCLCFAVVTGYPLYHGLVVTAVQPWYTLEPVCHYALLVLALLLQAELFGLELRQKLLLAVPGMTGLTAAILRFGAAAVLPDGAGMAFSLLTELLKYYTALCLLATALWAVSRGKAHSRLLLSGAGAMAVCLVWDRLRPMYEPVCGLWFGELGAGFLVAALAAALWLEAARSYRFRLIHEDSLRQMQRLLSIQKEHYTQLSQQIRLTREASHDLRHHMRTLRGLAQQKQWDRLEQYLREYEPHLDQRAPAVWSEHPAANALLSHYAQAVAGSGVSYDVRLDISPDIPLPDDELCVILGNLMENAVDAVLSQTGGPRRIYLRGEVSGRQLRLVLDNTFSGQLLRKEGVWLSSKHPGAGLGLQSVATIVEKYGGLLDCTPKPGWFQISLLIPLPVNTSIEHRPR